MPAGGGVYEGRRISAAQARSIALRVGVELAAEEEEEYHAADNTTVRQLCDMMLAGKLGRVSMATYENARVDYRQFLAWLGRRADEPARLISRADVKGWIDARRREVRHNTVCKALGAIRAAFGWAVDAGVCGVDERAGWGSECDDARGERGLRGVAEFERDE